MSSARTHVLVGVVIAFLISSVSTARADSYWQPSAAKAVASVFPPRQPSVLLTAESVIGASIPQGPATHPPEHTGFRTLLKDTGKDFLALPKRRSTWVILAVGAGAAALAHTVDAKVQRQITTSTAAGRLLAPGKYIGATYTQVGVALGLYTVGRFVVPRVDGEPQTNKWSHVGFDLIRAQIVSLSITQGIKHSVRRDRPTGECCSFPSGHAAAAFAAASVLERHFGYRFTWPTVLGGLYVATSRLHDNVHFLSDVMFGAAVGTVAGWTVVGRHGHDTFALVPAPTHGGVMLTLARVR